MSKPDITKVVPPCKGMIGRRYGSPEVALDDRIGAESERIRIETIRSRVRQHVPKVLDK